MKGFGLERKQNPEVLADPMKLMQYQERQQALNWHDGRGQDPLRILMRLEERADRSYDYIVEHRSPTMTRRDYRRAYINRNLFK